MENIISFTKEEEGSSKNIIGTNNRSDNETQREGMDGFVGRGCRTSKLSELSVQIRDVAIDVLRRKSSVLAHVIHALLKILGISFQKQIGILLLVLKYPLFEPLQYGVEQPLVPLLFGKLNGNIPQIVFVQRVPPFPCDELVGEQLFS